MASDPVAVDLLGKALGLLGAAWRRLGGDVPEAPEEAVEAALKGSTGYQHARREVAELLRRLLDDGLDTALLLDLESAQNKAAAEALEAGWRLGFTGGRMKSMGFKSDGEFLAQSFEWLKGRIARIRAEKDAQHGACCEGGVEAEVLRAKEDRLRADIDGRLAVHRGQCGAFEIGLDRLCRLHDLTEDERTITLALVAPALGEAVGDEVLDGLGTAGGAWTTASDLLTLLDPGDVDGWIRFRPLFVPEGKLRSRGVVEVRSATADRGAKGDLEGYWFISRDAFNIVVRLEGEVDAGAGR